MIEHPGEKLEDVPSSDRLSAGVLTPGPGAADNLAGGFVPLEALERERATDAVAAEANGHEAFFHRRSSVHREAAVPPAQHVSDNDFGDLAACHEQPQDLSVEKLLDLDGVEGQKVPEGADRQPAAIGQQDVEVRMPAQKLAGSLKEADRARDDLLAVESSRIVELEGPPGAAGRLTEAPAVEAEEDPQPLGDCEDDLPVRHLGEERAGHLLCAQRRRKPQRSTGAARKERLEMGLVAQTVGSSNTKWDSNTLFAWLHDVAALRRAA